MIRGVSGLSVDYFTVPDHDDDDDVDDNVDDDIDDDVDVDDDDNVDDDDDDDTDIICGVTWITSLLIMILIEVKADFTEIQCFLRANDFKWSQWKTLLTVS